MTVADSGPTAFGRAGSTSVDGKVTYSSIPASAPVKHVFGTLEAIRVHPLETTHLAKESDLRDCRCGAARPA